MNLCRYFTNNEIYEVLNKSVLDINVLDLESEIAEKNLLWYLKMVWFGYHTQLITFNKFQNINYIKWTSRIEFVCSI